MKFLIFCWKRSTWTSKSLPAKETFKRWMYFSLIFFSSQPKTIEKTETNHHPGGGHLENFFRWGAKKTPGYREGSEGRRSFDEMFWGVAWAVTIKPCCNWVYYPVYIGIKISHYKGSLWANPVEWNVTRWWFHIFLWLKISSRMFVVMVQFDGHTFQWVCSTTTVQIWKSRQKNRFWKKYG